MFRMSGLIYGCIASVLVSPFVHANGVPIDNVIVVAAARNTATTQGDFAYSARWNMEAGGAHIATARTQSSFDGTRGLSTQAQNTGANSIVQNSISIASADLCGRCTLGTAGVGGVAIGNARNQGRIESDLDFPGYGPSGGWMPGSGSTSHGGDPRGHSSTGTTPDSHGLDPQGSDPEALTANSFNGDVGVFDSGQNVGDNSVTQNAVAIGVMYARNRSNALGQYGKAENNGLGVDNTASSFDTQTATYIKHSVNDSIGVDSSGQNASPNSLVQNSTSVFATEYPLGGGRLGQVTAVAANAAETSRNYASTNAQYNDAGVSESFDHSMGILQAAQNVGSNSMLQNTTSLSVGMAMR